MTQSSWDVQRDLGTILMEVRGGVLSNSKIHPMLELSCSASPRTGFFLPTSWEGATGSWHAGGSDLAAPLTTSCVFT